MALVTLDLPTPAELRAPWAAFAAVCAARGWADSCYANGSVWHYDDGAGNWTDLHHLDDGRAVLLGNDQEVSDTTYTGPDEPLSDDQTDLLAGAPDWWETAVREAMGGFDGHSSDLAYLGFVYGFDGDVWQRAEYTANDGFGSVGLPALSVEDAAERITEFVEEAPEIDDDPEPEAVEALLEADGAITDELVAGVVGWTAWDPAAGAAGGRAFLES